MPTRKQLITDQLDKIEVVITTPGFHPSPPYMEAIRDHLVMAIDLAYSQGWDHAVQVIINLLQVAFEKVPMVDKPAAWKD